MVKINSKLTSTIGVFITLVSFGIPAALANEISLATKSIEEFQDNEDFKYGQYVYVTLKDGSQTVGKIVGKKSPKKYYVNQLDGSLRGLVHVKYIKKMTKEEVADYKASQKKKQR